jgi:hypothetical protein
MTRSVRAGFILPFVLLAIAATAMVLFAYGTAAFRAFRGARGAASSARVQLAAETALATSVADWARDSVTMRPLGSILTRSDITPAGLWLERRWVRTAPDVAWLTIAARDGVSSGAGRPAAHLTRVLWLESPALSLAAAITATGAIELGSGSRVVAPTLSADSSGCAHEPSPPIHPVHTLLPSALPPALTTAWGTLMALAPPRALVPSDTLRPRWQAARLDARDSVLAGPLIWHGLLLHDGPLRVTGNVSLHGLLVVRGPFDARAARLTVRGAIVIADPASSTAWFGGLSAVAWDRCRVQMALATVSTPRSRPFFAWHAVTP